MREYLEVLLTRVGYRVSLAGNEKTAIETLGGSGVDVVISDMKLGQGSGLNVLKAARALAAPPEVVLITAFGTPAAAVEAMRAGAYDYICKPFDNEELKLLVQKALEKRGLREENRQLRRSLSGGRGGLWVGESQAMKAVWGLVEKVAPSRTTVLITGESGTGKELVARALHLRSTRAGAPFLPVNCAALNEGVLESELFGHVKGAFTGAQTDRSGILVSAGEGTVFLDEIGEVPLATQVKLLRVLQERRVKPVGSSTEVPFQARVVAATNKRLEAEVKAGRFREDLLYRLNVITVDLPPLRERQGDISLLARHFLAKMREELGRPNLEFSAEAVQVLERYVFPGNVRQLQNIVERAATLADSDTLGPDTLPSALRGEREPEPQVVGEVTLPVGFSLERHLDDAERRYLVAALQRSEGVKTRAAELLGLSFRSFRYRLAKHGLSEREDGGEPAGG
ncbi:sigma-54-dependent transcriptional regulator [Stigmatella aurantiaca]|uniref:Regulatory protein n=1 Tax=Stigmatella aurantiaca (strain DW4/3-1) TaxID=378806 RepID=Q08YY9_STIAD|nr:sigma-54 dependent transcriptional regulator [Stigmatella aurantiaca]ADO74211.1 Pilin regulatory protein PilR [Stigmatella aurantiaca DW4/3-1]EAU65715.1 regulatory protein [Stigmatella aurantiaca DW4/3-1]